MEEAVERQTGNIVDSPRTIAAVQEARLAFRIVGGEALESAHPGAPEVTRWRNRTVTEGDCALRAPYRWGESGSEQASGIACSAPRLGAPPDQLEGVEHHDHRTGLALGRQRLDDREAAVGGDVIGDIVVERGLE